MAAASTSAASPPARSSASKWCAARSRRCGARTRSARWCRSSPSARARPTHRALSGSFEGGSFNTIARRRALSRRRAAARCDYQAGLSHRRTDGAFADILPEEDKYEQTAFDGGLGGAARQPRCSLQTQPALQQGGRPLVWGDHLRRRATAARPTTPTNLSWNARLSTTPSAAATRAPASFNYFRYDSTSANTIADPTL